MKELEIHSRDALRNLLSKIPILEIKSLKSVPLSKAWTPDFTVEVNTSGKSHSLVCEVKASGQPRFINAAILQLRDYVNERNTEATPIVVAPYLSPAARQACREKGVGYLDLEGNSWISFDGVFIDHQVADRPPSENRALKSLFKPKISSDHSYDASGTGPSLAGDGTFRSCRSESGSSQQRPHRAAESRMGKNDKRGCMSIRYSSPFGCMGRNIRASIRGP